MGWEQKEQWESFKVRNLGEGPMEMNLRPQRKEDCCSAAAGILLGAGGVGVTTRSTGVGKLQIGFSCCYRKQWLLPRWSSSPGVTVTETGRKKPTGHKCEVSIPASFSSLTLFLQCSLWAKLHQLGEQKCGIQNMVPSITKQSLAGWGFAERQQLNSWHTWVVSSSQTWWLSYKEVPQSSLGCEKQNVWTYHLRTGKNDDKNQRSWTLPS